MARAPVSKTGGWGFESLHSCHPLQKAAIYGHNFHRLPLRDSRLPLALFALWTSVFLKILHFSDMK
jgi:hypothetical protein